MLTSGRFRVKTGYITAFFLLLVSYFLIFLTLQQFLTQSKWVEHTDLVINDLEMLAAHTNKAESAARGYVLLNDTDHLQTFYTTTKEIDILLRGVDSVTNDNEVQQKRADTLKGLIQEKLGRIYRGILLFQQAGNVITDEMRSRGEVGKKLMLEITDLIQRMEQQETQLLRFRKEKVHRWSISIRIITITSLIIALVLSAYSYITYSRESNAKRQADGQTDSYRKQLENKVKELQAANEELRELRSLEKFTATGRIARTIAHEIRNPLTNIGLASEQIKEIAGKDEEAVMLLNMITRNANRINQMISELLTSTKFAQLYYSTININDLLDETLELARDRIELKQIIVVKRYQLPGSEVFVDADKMKIAFLNIIVNAIEAMEKDTGVLEIEVASDPDKCVVDFTDNGTGMNDEVLQKLFDPYFTNKAGGNGLGLTNTQNIILNHKGTINVKSKPGQGSTFTVTLSLT